MANNKNPEEGTNAGEELRGGTRGDSTAPASGGTPGGTNALSPTGTARPTGRAPEPPTGDKAAAERQDPQRGAEGGRTKPSPGAAAQRARDQTDASGTQSGIDEDNPRQIPEDAPAPDGRTENN